MIGIETARTRTRPRIFIPELLNERHLAALGAAMASEAGVR
jgi:hypothetical protein